MPQNSLINVGEVIDASDANARANSLNKLRIDASRQGMSQSATTFGQEQKQYSEQERMGVADWLFRATGHAMQNPQAIPGLVDEAKQRGLLDPNITPDQITFDQLNEIHQKAGGVLGGPGQPQFTQQAGDDGSIIQTETATGAQNQVQGRRPAGININNPPQTERGFQNVYDDQNRFVRQEPIPGGSVDREMRDAANKESSRRGEEVAGADLLLDEISRSFERIGPNAGGFIPAAGPGGALGRAIPDALGGAATKARQLEQIVQTIKANIGFGALQTMRQNSPTGGALGNVSDTEVRTLQAVAGNLDPNQPDWMFGYNLSRLYNKYQDVIHGIGNGSRWAAPERAYRRLYDLSYENNSDLSRREMNTAFKSKFGYLPPGFEEQTQPEF